MPTVTPIMQPFTLPPGTEPSSTLLSLAFAWLTPVWSSSFLDESHGIPHPLSPSFHSDHMIGFVCCMSAFNSPQSHKISLDTGGPFAFGRKQYQYIVIAVCKVVLFDCVRYLP